MSDNSQNIQPQMDLGKPQSHDGEKIFLPPDLFSRNTLLSWLVLKLAQWPKLRILDVGGFGSHLSWFLPPETKFVILDKKEIDPTETALYRQGDAKRMPFSDNNFDVAIGSDLLEHAGINDRDQIINEMLRVTRNYLIIAGPCKNNLIKKAEDCIREQYQSYSNQEHPFLKEHKSCGLPEEEDLELSFYEKNLKFFKIREGNLMNWYIQQLYNTTQYGEAYNQEKLRFSRFFNEHLYELGNLRAPAYRTIYIISKNGDLPGAEIESELEQKFGWNAEVFMELLRMGFDDLRKFIEQRKSQLLVAETHLASLKKGYETLNLKHENILAKARKSIEAHRLAIQELRNFLIEKEQALNLLKAVCNEKESTIHNLEEIKKSLEQKLETSLAFMEKLNFELKARDSQIDLLKNHITRTEELLQQKQRVITAQNQKLEATNRDLDNHKNSLRVLLNSRAWKAVMIYSKIKTFLITKPKILALKYWKLAKKGWGILTTFGPKVFWQRLVAKMKKAPTFNGNITEYDQYITETGLKGSDMSAIRRGMAGFDYTPVISIVMPVYNVAEEWLVKAIESVINQAYTRWELCICDDASTLPSIRTILEQYAKKDHRIKVVYRQKNGGIVKASNDALKLANGAYVGLLDNDDELAVNALYEVIAALQQARYDLVYSDEDKLDMQGRRCDPFFKPDWSPDLLLSINYISHFGVYKRKIVQEIGGFREGFDGSQDYDLVLRFTEKTQSIKHIPQILYHWRKIPGSTAAEVNAKPYAFESAKKALREAIKRRNITGNITDGIWPGSYRLKRAIKGAESGTIITKPESGIKTGSGSAPEKGLPLVSVIIPFKDKIAVTRVCITSIITKTTYSNYEILLVDNRSELLETAEYLKQFDNSAANPKIKVLHFDAPFNFSAINNYAVKHANGDFLVLLNNDTEVLTPDWIESMLEHAQRPEVGAVGAKLLYPNNTVQHAGVVIGVGGIANHAFSRKYKDDHGYFGQIDLIRNYSAVTAACVMIRKDLYLQMGGLDENNLAVSFNDVDFCLRLREKGYLIVYTPYAQLYHYESLSRGYDVNLKEVDYIQRRHQNLLQKGDPYYNPNLTRERFDFSLRVGDKGEGG